MKPTIRDVARAAGVSVATASMALNNKAGVSLITRSRVCEIAKEMQYVPDYLARSLVMQDSNCIGLMIPEMSLSQPSWNLVKAESDESGLKSSIMRTPV